jgi:predicted component of type VI protein secretion system
MIEAELHVIGGKHSGQVIPLNRRKFLIGRESDCQLRPNSELVSRHHCVFSIDDYAVRLRDLGSTNGTTVNGQRIVKEVTLVAGDRCVVGNLEFEFRVLSPATAAGDEAVVSGTETVMEISSASDAQGAPQAPAPPQSVPGAATQQLPVMDQMSPVNGDTTVINQPVMMPGQTPYQPMMPQPMGGFPGQAYGGYPYQPMPMYPQGYPQQPMMPGQMPPGYHQPAPAVPMPPIPLAGESSSDAGVAAPEVSLPDPSQTGASPPVPKPAAPDAGGGSKPSDGDSTNAAADIIRQYTQRRPGGQ